MAPSLSLSLSSAATTRTEAKKKKNKKSSLSSSSSSSLSSPSSSSSSSLSSPSPSSSKSTIKFYKLCAAELPDELFRKEINVKKWIGNYDNKNNENNDNKTDRTSSSSSSNSPLLPWMKATSNKNGFNSNTLNTIIPLQDNMIDYERCIGISLYMIGNVTPFLIPILLLAWLIIPSLLIFKNILIFIVIYQSILYTIERYYFVPYFFKKYKRGKCIQDDIRVNDPLYSQYLFTERNTTKYCSLSYVWPSCIHRPALENNNVIYCLIPHGLAPYGVVGYPYWSKIWNNKLCSWTCAPVLFTLPIIGNYMKSIGYIPAKSSNILNSLIKKDNNVGIILDGINGMFYNSHGNSGNGSNGSSNNNNNNNNNEVGAILKRKGIIKIAIKANVPIIPCYAFGHTQMYNIYVDPFGILQYISKKLGMSITPFFGRYGWFMGPPKNDIAVTVCLGEPIYPPTTSISASNNSTQEDITQEQIDSYHTKLLDGFTTVFETHKSGYYGNTAAETKKLIFVE